MSKVKMHTEHTLHIQRHSEDTTYARNTQCAEKSDSRGEPLRRVHRGRSYRCFSRRRLVGRWGWRHVAAHEALHRTPPIVRHLQRDARGRHERREGLVADGGHEFIGGWPGARCSGEVWR